MSIQTIVHPMAKTANQQAKPVMRAAESAVTKTVQSIGIESEKIRNGQKIPLVPGTLIWNKGIIA